MSSMTSIETVSRAWPIFRRNLLWRVALFVISECTAASWSMRIVTSGVVAWPSIMRRSMSGFVAKAARFETRSQRTLLRSSSLSWGENWRKYSSGTHTPTMRSTNSAKLSVVNRVVLVK